MNVDPREGSYNDGRQSGNKSVVFIRPINESDDSSAHCFERPHYIFGILAILFGLLLFTIGLGGFGRFWGQWSAFGQVGLGLILVISGIFCIYHGFGLIEFEVYPCPAQVVI
jgi:hypothetical protein